MAAVLFATAGLLVSCGSSQDEVQASRAVRSVVDQFFQALVVGDNEALALHAPTLVDSADRLTLNQIGNSISSDVQWEIRDVSIDGRRASAEVALTGLEAASTTRIMVPLRRRDDVWTVSDTLEISQTLDFVPIDR